MARYREDYELIKKSGAVLLAIGPDSPEAFKRYWEENHLPFTGLPDHDHAVAMRYKQEVKLFKLGRMPMVCIVDARGVIRYTHYGNSMADIPDNRTLLEVIEKLNKASK